MFFNRYSKQIKYIARYLSYVLGTSVHLFKTIVQ